MTTTDTPAVPPAEPIDSEAQASLVPPEVVAQTFREYLRALFLRLKSGESGMLPVVLALIAITIVFQAISPNHVFLSPGNVVNLLQQSAVFMVLAMAECFALLLGDIDLSIGFVGPLGGAIAVQLVQPQTTGWNWLLAIFVALVACAAIGAVQGTLITRLRLPSFIVTLAGLLVFNGVVLIVVDLGPFSGAPALTGSQGSLMDMHDLMWGQVTPLESWIAMGVVVAVVSASILVRDIGRRRSGLVSPPASLTYIKVAFVVVIAVLLVLECNRNRANVGTLEGVPWFVFIVIGILAAWTFLLQRTRYGRYVYAIGGNAEAARRAGINVAMIRTWAFVICSLTAGVAGILYASELNGVSNNITSNGGQLVLYAVAASVIGGTSLFGGRGKVAHGVLGGLVIGAIYNGMFLLNLQASDEYIVTGGVLLFAVTVDALSRRGSSSGSATRV